MKNKEGKLFIYAGASGVGKGTIMKELLKADDSIRLSVSATTRSPREGEVDGREYFFITRDEFENKIKEGGFLEHAVYCDNYYGTPEKSVNDMLARGYNVFLEIELEGATNVMRLRPDAVTIFILPPSMEELERRLRTRGTETEESIAKRLERAKVEIGSAHLFKHNIINEDVAKAVKDVLAIVNSKD